MAPLSIDVVSDVDEFADVALDVTEARAGCYDAFQTFACCCCTCAAAHEKICRIRREYEKDAANLGCVKTMRQRFSPSRAVGDVKVMTQVTAGLRGVGLFRR